MNEAPQAILLTPSSDFVQSLARGLAVIRAFDGTRPELGLSEVSRATGLTRATARRLLLTLVRLGCARTEAASLCVHACSSSATRTSPR
jgi:hypothetical protein